MLRVSNTNDDLKSFFEESDKEFETLESVIKNALKIIDVYEKQIELFDLR
jgi:hypothetical protein